jgi:TatD DNase family protein
LDSSLCLPDLIDTHTHLSASEFDGDRDEVIQRANAVGINTFITIGAGYGAQSAKDAVALSERRPNVFASVGLHPNDAAIPFDDDLLPSLASHPKVVAIGETGFDFYWDHSTKEQQERWFRHQIELALAVKKPIVIHSRDAGAECLALLKEYPVHEVRGVFHCFAEDVQFAQKLRDLGFLISIPGTVTFKNAESVRTVAKEIPLDQLMLETDAPFLAPLPNRGKRNESSYMIEVAKRIAELRSMPLESLAAATSANARALFKLAL